MHIQPDYPNDIETTKMSQQSGGRMNGFVNNNFRASFTSYPNTTRQQANPSAIGGPPLRDTNVFYSNNPDVFPGQVTSPIQPHLQPYEGNNVFDFGPKGFNESFGPSGPVSSHHGGRHSMNHGQPQGHHKFNGNHQFGGPVQLTSQTPYGPHIPINQANGPPNGPHGSQQASREQNAPTGSNQQEEISTIFVVGFPDDMQEREFQNMFTFSSGFEAATLKIPNKEYTAYGANGIRGYQGYNGSNDPYNLVTMNQGGVVVDGGRDGTMSSWPAVGGDEGHHFGGVNLTPRKQIIGFAKFKSREAALEARDILQGRRVDIEKGAILKAEMAKKNLHTKRGVGPVAGPALPGAISASNSMQSNTHGHGHGIAPSAAIFHQSEAFPIRESELPIGGLDLGRHGTWRDQLQKDVLAVTNGINSSHATELHPRKERDEEENRRRERDANMYSAMGFGGSIGPTRGPRERVEEEERERRKAKEARLRASNSTAFDAFHSVPAGNAPALSRTNSGVNVLANLSSLEGSVSLGSSPHLSNAFAANHHEEVGPWDRVPNGVTRPGSERSSSPPESAEFGQAFSAPSDAQRTAVARPASESSASSVVGSNSVGVIGGGSSVVSNISEVDLNAAMNDLVLNTDNGTTSPQLPSPASGASSNGTKNAVDQNPPINTLYVGNLPASTPSIGFSNDQLEDSIRQLFQAQPGYRRLVFRQKNNGPMCFVEFEDIPFATKALNDLYGNTLNGLVKGGIRLSYSKNPLGVRTPTAGSGFQHQQAMQSLTLQSDQFHSRLSGERDHPAPLVRREGGYNNTFMASPPPRFTSPPMGNFGQQSLSNVPGGFGVRSNGGSLPGGLYSFGGLNNQGGNGNFAPFGLNNPTIPEHPSSDDSVLHPSHHFAHRALSPPVNIEAARAG